MPTTITMFYCEQYPKVPPNGWSEDSWRKDTTERLHRDSLWHLEGWQLNLMFFQDLAENEIRFRTERKRPEENSELEFIELKLKNSNSIVNFMLTMITMFYCWQYPKVPPNGWSEDSWRKDTTERLHRDSLWHLEGWQLNLMFFQDLAENEIRLRTTRKRPEENSESEFIELKLKNSNSIVNFMPTMITMFYCEQYPKVPPNGWSEDSWRKDTTERLHRDSLWQGLSRGRAFEMLVRQILVFRHTLSPITSFLDQGSSGTSEQNSTNSVNRRPFAWESWWDLLFNKKGQCSERRSWGMRTIVCHNNQQASKCNLLGSHMSPRAAQVVIPIEY